MKILICGNYGVKNVGDEAILLGFRSLLAKNFPEAQLTVMGAGKHFPFGVNSLFQSLFHWDLWKTPMALLNECDVFVLGGGGLFTEEESKSSPLFWALQGLVAILKKKPVYCLGISVEPLSSLNRFFAKMLFKKAKKVMVRDRASRDLLLEWGISSELASDLATEIDFEYADSLGQENYVIVTLRPFKNFDENLYKKIAQLCDALIHDFGLKIRFIPFHSDAKMDASIMNKILERMSNASAVAIEPFYENPLDLIRVFSQARAVIGMRLHSGILSLIASTPFIPINYMSKVENFWEEFQRIFPLHMPQIENNFITIFTNLFNQNREHRAYVSQIRSVLRTRNQAIRNLIQTWKNISK
jgi:polysaccharide pyruvyl transferase CsaB